MQARSALSTVFATIALLSGLAGTPGAQATPSATPPPLNGEVTRLLNDLVARPAPGAPAGRIDVEVGQLDARLRLAPCTRVQPYLPPGQRPWGRLQVGLRCTEGPVAWNVYLPVVVHVWAPAVVTRTAVAADAELRAGDLELAEVDLAERPSPSFQQIEALVGRRVAVALAPGATIRQDVLKLRQWFGAGDTVTVLAQGPGYAVSSPAQALTPGLDGQTARVRTEAGRLLTVWPVGERQAELRQ